MAVRALCTAAAGRGHSGAAGRLALCPSIVALYFQNYIFFSLILLNLLKKMTVSRHLQYSKFNTCFKKFWKSHVVEVKKVM